jgi:gluconate kinase
MPKSLLQSQFDALEEPAPEEHAITIWVGKSAAVLVDEIVAALAAAPPGILQGSSDGREGGD